MIQIGIKRNIKGIQEDPAFLKKDVSSSIILFEGFLVKDKTTTEESENHVNTVRLLG